MCRVLGKSTLRLSLPRVHPGKASLRRALRLPATSTASTTLTLRLMVSKQIDTLSSITAALGLIGHCRGRFCRGVPCVLSRCGRPRVQPLLLYIDGRVAHRRTADQLILVGLRSAVAVSRRPVGHVPKPIHRLSRIAVLCVQGWTRVHLVLKDKEVGLGVGCTVAVCVAGAAHLHFAAATLPGLGVCADDDFVIQWGDLNKFDCSSTAQKITYSWSDVWHSFEVWPCLVSKKSSFTAQLLKRVN